MKNRTLSTMTILLGAAVVMTGCETKGLRPPVTHDITIPFTSAGGKQCPDTGRPPKKITVDRNDKIRWVSAPEGMAFTITFDPFKGNRYKATGGKTTAHKINPRSLPSDPPAGEDKFTFKYSINAPDCVSIDPKIIVRR